MQAEQKEHVDFWHSLYEQLDIGQPLIKSLEVIGESMTDTDFGRTIQEMIKRIRAGDDFAATLQEFPQLFTRCDMLILQGGAASSAVDTAIKRLADGIQSGAFPRRNQTVSDEDQHLFWRALGLLLSTGVPILNALEAAAEEAAGPALQEAARAIRQGILDGRGMAQTVADMGPVFPPQIAPVLAAGERNRNLAEVVLQIADALAAGRYSGGDLRRVAEYVSGDVTNDSVVIETVNNIITTAVKNRASDIHFDPRPDGIRVRHRVDGVLQEMEPPPAELRDAIIQRLKLMAGCDISERKRPQDARILIEVDDESVDLRLSILPNIHGERAVLRVLTQAMSEIPLSDIGFEPADLETVRDLIRQPNGIILVTGPTGSGTTTLMYSLLAEINDGTRCLCTAEDPVQLPIKGVNQLQILPRKGLTFTASVRAMLRQDPDVIMVGEIRDLETANTCVQAAMTGHVVITGLHTNTTADAIKRLLDMGLEPFLVKSTVIGVVSLRLARELCPACKAPQTPDSSKLSPEVQQQLSALDSPTFHRAAGCDDCRQTGHRGRTAIAEVLRVTDAIREIVTADVDPAAIRELAVKDGMHTLLDNGIAKAATGRVALGEILQVVPDVENTLAEYPTPPEPKVEMMPVEEVILPTEMPVPEDMDELKIGDEPTGENIIALVNQVIIKGIKANASDIHFEPYEDEFRIRYRIDGTLRSFFEIPKDYAVGTTNRLKILSALDLAEKRLPQDGRIQIRCDGKPYDLRVSALPTLFGEKVVLRILDRERVQLDLGLLGLDPADLATVRGLSQLPYGMVIVNGPTGCGKTTLLYGMLQSINTPDRSIITVEDPVEYEIAGLSQSRLNLGIGLGFPMILRSMLRQAPNVIMVGEIRDFETLTLAAHAAITGHLVFTTLHAGTSVGALQRLLDIGLEPFLVNAGLAGIVTPRLVRRLCPDCSRVIDPQTLDLSSAVGDMIADIADPEFREPVGCDKCLQSGYRGRTAIHEILVMNEQLRSDVTRKASAAELHQTALNSGMRSLLRCGIDKAAAGITSLQEILRILPAE